MPNAQDNTAQPRSGWGIALWTLFGLTSIVYLVNPSAGIIELIPDNLPAVGNLDEATATVLLLSALRYLTGRDLTLGKRQLKAPDEAKP